MNIPIEDDDGKVVLLNEQDVVLVLIALNDLLDSSKINWKVASAFRDEIEELINKVDKRR